MPDPAWTRALLQAMLDVEAALARAQAATGVIPPEAAVSIAEAGRIDRFDVDAIVRGASEAGNLVIPLVQQLTARVAERDAAAARYVHWGATSQDIIDTALVVRLRAIVPAIVADLDRCARAAAGHARRYLDTAIVGRTWLQHATPTTFGLKAAGWLDGLMRARRTVRSALDDLLVVQLGGASGTLASLGDAGTRVAAAFALALDLREPALPWHTQRERMAALSCGLGITCGTLGKIARDLALLAQTEVREAHDPASAAGGSSTMPHKQNPVRAAAALAASIRAPGLVATMLAAMVQEHERGVGGWPAEWDTLRDLTEAAATSARATAGALEELVVDPSRMAANLAITRGRVMAEAVAMRLAAARGKQEAHRLVEAAARRSIDEQRELVEILAADPVVSASIERADLERLMRPDTYLGSATTFVKRALDAYDAEDHA